MQPVVSKEHSNCLTKHFKTKHLLFLLPMSNGGIYIIMMSSQTVTLYTARSIDVVQSCSGLCNISRNYACT